MRTQTGVIFSQYLGCGFSFCVSSYMVHVQCVCLVHPGLSDSFETIYHRNHNICHITVVTTVIVTAVVLTTTRLIFNKWSFVFTKDCEILVSENVDYKAQEVEQNFPYILWLPFLTPNLQL